MLSNLPPGVTENMLPGNTPADVAWDKFIDYISVADITAQEAGEIWELGMKEWDRFGKGKSNSEILYTIKHPIRRIKHWIWRWKTRNKPRAF